MRRQERGAEGLDRRFLDSLDDLSGHAVNAVHIRELRLQD